MQPNEHKTLPLRGKSPIFASRKFSDYPAASQQVPQPLALRPTVSRGLPPCNRTSIRHCCCATGLQFSLRENFQTLLPRSRSPIFASRKFSDYPAASQQVPQPLALRPIVSNGLPCAWFRPAFGASAGGLHGGNPPGSIMLTTSLFSAIYESASARLAVPLAYSSKNGSWNWASPRFLASTASSKLR